MRKLYVYLLTPMLAVLLAVPALAGSILPSLTTEMPVLITAPSLHSVTANDVYKSEITMDGGLLLTYLDVSTAGYDVFGAALGKEGYTLVSADTGDGGMMNLVVAGGGVTLAITYDQASGNMTVLYPPNAEPRLTDRYASYTELKDGDGFPAADGVTGKITGWRRVKQFTETYYSSMYLITNRNTIHKSEDGLQLFILTFEIDNGTILPVKQVELLQDISLSLAGEELLFRRFGGLEDRESAVVNCHTRDGYAETVDAGSIGFAGLGFALTREQLDAGGILAITFTVQDHAARYVYFLDPGAGAQ